MVQRSRIDAVRERAVRRIELNRIAGLDTRHNRATNLLAVKELVAGHPHYTFGLKGIERFTEKEVLEAIADITKCSKDHLVRTGGGFISPLATLAGLEKASNIIYPLARQGGWFYLATGHPGSLLLYYIELGKAIIEWGGNLVQAERGAFVPPNFDLDYVEGVGVLSDRCSLLHSHDPKPMERVIASRERIDLVVSDHGFAAGAVNAGIPTIGVLDTNDPALAVARRMGANIVVVPMDDNRPMYNYLPAVAIIRDFAAQHRKGEASNKNQDAGIGSKGHSLADLDPRPEIELRFNRAYALVLERLGNPKAVDEAVEDILEPYTAQFLEKHFEPEEEENLINDPFTTLAIYKIYNDALRRYIKEQISLRQIELTEEETKYYFDNNGP